MGQPSAPQTVFQQPTQSEQDANKLANQQKAAALAKINQAVRGESEGLRGMGGLYEWAGPTPWLAGDPRKGGGGGGKGGKDPNIWGNQPGEYGPGPGNPGWQKLAGTPLGDYPMNPPGGGGPPGDRTIPGPTAPVFAGEVVGQGPYGDRNYATQPGTVLAGTAAGPRDDRTNYTMAEGGSYQGKAYVPLLSPALKSVFGSLGVTPPKQQGNAPPPSAFAGASPMQAAMTQKLTGKPPAQMAMPEVSPTQIRTPSQNQAIAKLTGKPAPPVTAAIPLYPVAPGVAAATAASTYAKSQAPATTGTAAPAGAATQTPVKAPSAAPAPAIVKTTPITPKAAATQPAIMPLKPSIYAQVGRGGRL